VKWARAVHHLTDLAEKCGGTPSFALRVVELWALGDILGAPRELEVVNVALAVDLPVHDVPWLSEPSGADHWTNFTRVAKNPILPLWRSVHAPVWNHRICRPALIWSAAEGVQEKALAALHEGHGEQVRIAEPTPDALTQRLDDELAVSLRAMRLQTRAYEERRWSPGKLTPVSDALWRVADGYLDLLDAARS
jgi:hypothetical protein